MVPGPTLYGAGPDCELPWGVREGGGGGNPQPPWICATLRGTGGGGPEKGSEVPKLMPQSSAQRAGHTV